jgi:chromosome segregation ATPase
MVTYVIGLAVIVLLAGHLGRVIADQRRDIRNLRAEKAKLDDAGAKISGDLMSVSTRNHDLRETVEELNARNELLAERLKRSQTYLRECSADLLNKQRNNVSLQRQISREIAHRVSIDKRVREALDYRPRVLDNVKPLPKPPLTSGDKNETF